MGAVICLVRRGPRLACIVDDEEARLTLARRRDGRSSAASRPTRDSASGSRTVTGLQGFGGITAACKLRRSEQDLVHADFHSVFVCVLRGVGVASRYHVQYVENERELSWRLSGDQLRSGGRRGRRSRV